MLTKFGMDRWYWNCHWVISLVSHSPQSVNRARTQLTHIPHNIPDTDRTNFLRANLHKIVSRPVQRHAQNGISPAKKKQKTKTDRNNYRTSSSSTFDIVKSSFGDCQSSASILLSSIQSLEWITPIAIDACIECNHATFSHSKLKKLSKWKDKPYKTHMPLMRDVWN